MELAFEIAEAVFRQPRGHVAAACDGRDLARVLLDLRIGCERERAGAARVVATGAVLINDGSDVAGEGDGGALRGGKCGDEKKDEE